LCHACIPPDAEAYCRDCDLGPVCPVCAAKHREETCAKKHTEEKGHDLYPASGTPSEGE
jgi:hypothetical protein